MRATPTLLQRLVLGCALLSASTATAFDPNAGAEPAGASRQPAHAGYATLPPNIVPARYYAPTTAPAVSAAPAPVVAAQPVVIAPPPIHSTSAPIAYVPPPAPPVYVAPTPTVAVIAPLPAVRAVPVEQPLAAATPIQGYVQPTATYPVENTPAQIAPRSGYKANRFSLGVEGYYDQYEEEVVNLTDKGVFGSVTASYEHYFNPNWYGGIDWRGSVGNTNYESTSGTIDDIRQWETEGRLLAGYDENLPSGQHLKVYTGAGTRFFYDDLKGKVASGGASGYDRRILQFYVPVGVTYEFAAYGLQFAPNVEFDQLIYGYVNSRLQNIPGFQELNNHQHTGYGLRGEFMMSSVDSGGRGWQFGPFIRYWNVADSDIDTTPAFTGLEPENSRLQVGAKLKWLF